MTPEELLKPRYKLIADYPGNMHRVGLVLSVDNEREEKMYGAYPHLFKKLEWWEERAPNDMPEYLRLDPLKSDSYFISTKERFKVYAWRGGFAQVSDNEADLIDNESMDFLPATEAEYIAYKQSEKNSS